MKATGFLRILILLLVTSRGIQAQAVPALPMPSLDQEESQRWVVKFAPLSLVDPNATIQFGVERMLGQHHSLQGEFGYGWSGMNLWHNIFSKRYTNIEIWRGRAEWRYYRNGGPIGSYIAVEGLYKQLNAYENGTAAIGCDNFNTCQYYQLTSLPITKRVWGVNFKVGRQFRLIRDNNRLLFDFYGGLGIRGNTVERSTSPENFYYYQSVGEVDLFSNTNKLLPSLSYGVKIGYSF